MPIALMNSTYSHVVQEQELHWRRQFLQQVLFLEATPPVLIPRWLGARTTARPAHHIAGTLHAMMADGGTMDIPTYYMQMERQAGDRVSGAGSGATLDAVMRAIEELRTQQRADRRISSFGSNMDAPAGGARDATSGVAEDAAGVDGATAGASDATDISKSATEARDEAEDAAGEAGAAARAALHATFDAMDARFATLERLLGAAVGDSSVPSPYKQKSRPKRKQMMVVRPGTSSAPSSPHPPGASELALLRVASPSTTPPSAGAINSANSAECAASPSTFEA